MRGKEALLGSTKLLEQCRVLVCGIILNLYELCNVALVPDLFFLSVLQNSEMARNNNGDCCFFKLMG